MAESGIPAAVLDFISKRIDTIPQLEALLIVSADVTREWSVDDIAARTYVARTSAAAALDALLSRKLIVSTGADRHYRFQPADDDERQVVAQTATAYRTNLISLTKFIHAKASTPVTEFARAFEMKKDHD